MQGHRVEANQALNNGFLITTLGPTQGPTTWQPVSIYPGTVIALKRIFDPNLIQFCCDRIMIIILEA